MPNFEDVRTKKEKSTSYKGYSPYFVESGGSRLPAALERQRRKSKNDETERLN